MALVAYQRLRMLWGALDWQEGTDTPYNDVQTVSGGDDAMPPGVGVRRCEIVWDRTSIISNADVAVSHFDFLNLTGGNPDDSWTAGDYTTLEGLIQAFVTTLSPKLYVNLKTQELRWYRVGPGIPTPNPAERVTPYVKAGTVNIGIVPPQVACSLTFRTAVRKSWGRTYIPFQAITTADMLPSARPTTAWVDVYANALHTLVTGAASNDFALVVMSKALNAALVVERIEVDDNLDVIRRRRWKASSYRKILP
jgi:hypothetical protein